MFRPDEGPGPGLAEAALEARRAPAWCQQISAPSKAQQCFEQNNATHQRNAAGTQGLSKLRSFLGSLHLRLSGSGVRVKRLGTSRNDLFTLPETRRVEDRKQACPHARVGLITARRFATSSSKLTECLLCRESHIDNVQVSTLSPQASTLSSDCCS